MADDKDSLEGDESDSDMENENEDKSVGGDAPVKAEFLGNKLLSDDEEEEDDEGERKDGLEMSQAYGSALSALPPTVTSFEENQFEVSSSPAFHELDKLFREGLLTGTQVALLKSKYTELHDLVRSNRIKEQALLQQAKDYTNQLERQKLELDQAENFPENCTTEVSKLRQQLLRCGNELKQTEERCEQLAYNIQCLEEDHRLIEKEYNRMPKQGEIEKKQDDLKQGNVELRKEINQRKSETKMLKEDLDHNDRQIQLREKEIEGIREQLLRLKSDLVAANAVPNQISKESDKLLRQKYETDKKVKDVDMETRQLLAELEKLQSRLTLLEDEKRTLDQDARESGLIHADREKNLQILMKDYEYAKNRETDLLVDKTKLDLNMKHLQLEKANIHEIHSRKVREKDHDLRELKKAELKVKISQDAFDHTKQTYDKVKQQLDGFPVDDSDLVAKKAELTKEVGQLRRALETQSGLTAVEQIKIEQSVAEEERLLYEQSDLRIEVVELTRLAAIKRDESVQKVRDLVRAEQNFREAKDELKAKQVIIEDHKKKDVEMQIRLKEFAKMYDVIKNERNKCVSLIQISTQKAAEMREKIKILQNEIEILRTTVAQKDRQLQKHRLKHSNAIIVRDSLRNEVSKQTHIQTELHEKDEQQRIDISKLEVLIKHAEQQMVDLRKRFESELKKRDARGVQLLNLEDELCIFYEKFNIQDQMVKNGNMELSGKEEEIRLRKINVMETKREIELLRKNLREKRSTEQELVTLQIQLAQCQDRMTELEQQVENPNEKNRARLIEGKDPEPLELQKIIEKLEDRLATKEERSLELQFVFEQICRLNERAEGEVKAGKTHTQNVAEKVNKVNAKLKHVTQKQMACVAELAMLQAESFQLQQQVRTKENVLELCHIRLEKGEAPTEQMEAEWLQMAHGEQRRLADRDATQIMTEQEGVFSLPDGSATTAEPRPNAYIPDEEHELPIPRPYGRHAPFRPTEPGSTMRHIRKPIPKPIEI